MKRMGWVIGVRPEKLDEYKRLHADAWPSVLAKIEECNIKNYTIYLREPENLLFAHLSTMAQNSKQIAPRWLTIPRLKDGGERQSCQRRLDSGSDGEQWSQWKKCSTATESIAMAKRLRERPALLPRQGKVSVRASAEAFFDEGAEVVATDISAEGLSELASAGLSTELLDVTDHEMN